MLQVLLKHIVSIFLKMRLVSNNPERQMSLGYLYFYILFHAMIREDILSFFFFFFKQWPYG